MPDRAPSQAFLPARRAPLLYFAFAHASLLAGLLVLAVQPSELGGFYYHSRLIAVVHLVTLGFITSSILGALYLVCPLALRLPLPERRRDLIMGLAWMVGVSGVASHFWIERYSGMAWSGAMALATPVWLGSRVLAGLPQAPVPLEARLPIGLAIFNLYVAGGLGVMLGVNKHQPFLPFAQLGGVHAHLHLAAVGFATLMVVGAGYRLLPMVLPAAMPRGRLAIASTVVIEAGTLGLTYALLFAPACVPLFAVFILGGLGLFLSRVAFMLGNRRPAPAARRRPDWPLFHALQALAYLAVSAGLGLALALLPASDLTLRLAMAYGVCGLLGFLSQMVLGVEARIGPMAAWLQGFAAGGHRELPPPLHTAMSQRAGAAALVLWTLGVPCLAVALALDLFRWITTGSACLAVAVALAAGSAARAVHALGVPARPPRDPV
jgi:hypothetical protein